METLSGAVGLAGTGFVGGLLLGLAARRGRFCTLGAIEDALYANDLGRVRMWALALAVAILGVFALNALELVDIESSIYTTVAWNPIASILGGLIFGYGMAISGNCGYGALTRLGGGDIRSFVLVLVMGVAAYMVMIGPLAPLRLALFPAAPPTTADFGAAAQIADATGAPALAWRWRSAPPSWSGRWRTATS